MELIRGCLKFPLNKIWITLEGVLGVINFCSYKPPCKSLNEICNIHMAINQAMHKKF
jgi:hypothetical protein